MNALFYELLTMSLSAAFLVGIVIGLRWCFRRAPKWVHCLLWALVAVRLVCPSLPESQLSMVPKAVSDSRAIVQMVSEIPQLAPQPAAQAQAQPEEEPEILEAPVQDVPGDLPLPQFVPEPAPEPASVDWMQVLTWVWVAGMGLMGVYALLSYLRIRRRVSASVAVGEQVSLCDYIDTPFLLGFFRPRIYLPSGLDSETAAHVLAHERAHLARRDHWWKPLGFLLLTVHWFNPMIWLGYTLLCRDIEMACDEAVVKAMGPLEKKAYSSALLQCSVPRRMISICPLAFGEISVKERIRSVLNYRKPALWLTIAGLLALIVGVPLLLTDPVKPFEGELEFYPTAVYIGGGRDELTLTEYDDEFRPISEVTYEHGEERYRSEYTYSQEGNTAIRTRTLTNAPAGTGTIFSDDASVSPGQTAVYVYTDQLDDKGNVLESVCEVNGQWVHTKTYTYDENGNPITIAAQDAESTTRYIMAYDERGNLIRKECYHENLNYDYSSEYLNLFTYDDHDRVLTEEYHKSGSVVYKNYSYDDQGRITSVKHNNFSNLPPITDIYQWDRNDPNRAIIHQTYEDGTRYASSLSVFDGHSNVLRTYSDTKGENIMSARNYICNDGSKSIGIPEDIYTPGKPITAHPEFTEPERPEIQLEVQDVTAEGARLLWHIPADYSGSSFFTGSRFRLETYNGSAWEQLKTAVTPSWNARELEHVPFSGGEFRVEYSVSWAGFYGLLPAGTYRITTSVFGSMGPETTAEFTVAPSPD